MPRPLSDHVGAAFKAAELSRQFKVKEVKLIDIQPYQINVRFQGPAAPSAQEALESNFDADGESDHGAPDADENTATTASTTTATTTADGITERVLFPAFSALNKRKQVSFLRDAPFSFDVVYAADGAPAGATPFPLHIATVQVDGFDSEQVQDYLQRTTKPAKARGKRCLTQIQTACG